MIRFVLFGSGLFAFKFCLSFIHINLFLTLQPLLVNKIVC